MVGSILCYFITQSMSNEDEDLHNGIGVSKFVGNKYGWDKFCTAFGIAKLKP